MKDWREEKRVDWLQSAPGVLSKGTVIKKVSSWLPTHICKFCGVALLAYEGGFRAEDYCQNDSCKTLQALDEMPVR